MEEEFVLKIFNLIKDIKDPEFDTSLSDLNVIRKENIQLKEMGDINILKIELIPTVSHCSMASLIGLNVIYKLKAVLREQNGKYLEDDSFKFVHLIVLIQEGTHDSWRSINKQLNDEERVRAAFENENIVNMLENNISFGYPN